MKKDFIDNIKKEKIVICLDILLYDNEEILSIDYKYVNNYNYKKIILIYDIINKLLKKIYYYYGNKSLNIIDKWYKNKKLYNIDILEECINNFIIKYKN